MDERYGEAKKIKLKLLWWNFTKQALLIPWRSERVAAAIVWPSYIGELIFVGQSVKVCGNMFGKNNLRRWPIGEYILRTIVGKTILGESFFSLSFVRNLQPYFDRLSADGVDGTLTFYGRVECVSIFAECVIGGPSWRVARRKNAKFERMWPVDGNNFLRLSYGRNETGHLMSIFAE